MAPRLALLAAFLLAPLATLAQEAARDTPALGPIPPEEWRAMTRGRTVTYMIGGEFWAREAYARSSDGVAIRLADGECLEGIWTYVDGAYCFDWSSGEYSCFRHVRTETEILIIPVVDGVESGAIQTVGEVDDTPLACGPALTS